MYKFTLLIVSLLCVSCSLLPIMTNPVVEELVEEVVEEIVEDLIDGK